MNAYVARFVTALCSVKHSWIVCDTSEMGMSRSLRMFVCHSLAIALNSVASSVGSRSVVISSPEYVFLGSKLFTCLLISWIVLRFFIAVGRLIDRTWNVFH